MLSEKSRPSCT